MADRDTPYTAALRALCEPGAGHGGIKGVADTIGASVDYLKQILSHTPLPSGNPRDVGPALRKKISRHFPGWLGSAAEPARPAARKPTPTADVIAGVASLAAMFALMDHAGRTWLMEAAQRLARGEPLRPQFLDPGEIIIDRAAFENAMGDMIAKMTGRTPSLEQFAAIQREISLAALNPQLQPDGR